MDFEAARIAMVDTQIRTHDVTDRRVVAALGAIPREAFLPTARHPMAYADLSVEIRPGRWMAPPRDIAKFINALAITEDSRVLDIAPGCGYSTALLSRLTSSLVALEEDDASAQAVRDGLAVVGISGVEVLAGPLKAGAPAKAPFDCILVNGAVEIVPDAWLAQLAEGGRLAVAVGEGRGVRRARVYTKAGGITAWLTPFDTAVPVLPGFEKAAEFRL